MKYGIMSLLFGLLAFTFSCTSASEEPAADEATEVATEGTDEAQVVASTDAYTTVITEDGIASPRKQMTGTIDGVELSIDYGSPAVKGREIWGGLNAFGQIWRAGANAATTITFAEDVLVEGEALAAGKYALFIIPDATATVVVFNTVTDQWGAGSYDEATDALRVSVAPEVVEANQESLEYMVVDNQVVLAWADWQIPFAVSAVAE